MNYKGLKFKCGLEVHRQLSTHKLFCDCPSLVNDPAKASSIITRKLRSTRGETQEHDKAAAYEAQKDKTFVYEGTKDSSCLVEFDEQPPKEVNSKALTTAIQIAQLMDCELIDQIQFMRKTVIDGSNPSGFQRTALIAVNGTIKTNKGKVGIESICLEEEAAKKIKTNKDGVTYRLDRLGVPLIEIATDATIKDPEHAKEVAELIGMIIKSTGIARQGIGSVRQDVNVSILDQPRIEIKGFQELKDIPLVITKEVSRLLEMDKKKKVWEAHVRKSNPGGSTSFLRPMPGAARMYPETDVETILIDKELLDSIELPELISEKTLKLEKQYNLPAHYARILVEDDNFTSFVDTFSSVKPKVIAQVLVEVPKEAKKRFKVNVTSEHIREVLELVHKGDISSNMIKEAVVDLAKGKKLDLKAYKGVTDKAIKDAIKGILAQQKEPSIGSVMGALMQQFQGKLDGKQASRLVAEALK